jgi:AraC-like DNA-binding protein
LAKIAATSIAQGDGWSVADVVCSAGPRDRAFEEQHDHVAIAIVTRGSFQYRASGAGAGRELMTPGSLLLGNPGQFFECGHEHAEGDRCLAFRYSPEYFARATDGVARRERFGLLRLPAARELSPIVVRACSRSDVGWEEIAVTLAGEAVRVDAGRTPSQVPAAAASLARVTRIVRLIEEKPDAAFTLAELAGEARLSPFHFLRTFEDLTGATPHQYLRRVRLRRAAVRLLDEPTKILELALDCGFGDVSNFNRAFRAEFGGSPNRFRALHRFGESARSVHDAMVAGWPSPLT